MAARYSLQLYFPAARVEDVLHHLVAMASKYQDQYTILVIDGREIEVPFTNDFKSGRTVRLGHTNLMVELDVVLRFPADEQILAYIDPQNHAPLGELVPVGYFYMSILIGRQYACFDFQAATSGMGRLFLNSPSVEKQFLDLLERCEGLFGVIDLDDDNLFEHPLLGNHAQTVYSLYLTHVDEVVEKIKAQLQ